MPRDQAVMPYWVPQILRPHKKVRGRLTVARPQRDRGHPEGSGVWGLLEGTVRAVECRRWACAGEDQLGVLGVPGGWVALLSGGGPSLLPPVLVPSLLPPALPSSAPPPSPCLSALSSPLGIPGGRGQSQEGAAL